MSVSHKMIALQPAIFSAITVFFLKYVDGATLTDNILDAATVSEVTKVSVSFAKRLNYQI